MNVAIHIEHQESQKNNRRTMLFAGANIFSYFTGFYLIVAMLPIIVSEELQLPAYMITFLFSLRYISGALYDGFLLKVSKQLGIKSSLIVGMIGILWVYSGFYFLRSFFAYIILFIFLGIIGGFNELRLIEKSQRMGPSGVTLYYSCFFGGIFVAFSTGGILLQYAGPFLLFSIANILFLLPILIVSCTSHHSNSKLHLRELLVKSDFIADELEVLSHLKDNMVYLFLLKFMADGWNSLKDLYVPLIVTQYFLQSKSEVSLVLGCALIPMFLIQRNLKRILKAVPPFFFLGGHKRRVIAFALFVLTVACFLLPSTNSFIAFTLLIVLCAVGFGLISPVLNLVVIKHHEHEADEESALLHLSAQSGKFVSMVVALTITYFSESLLAVFYFPAIIFLLLLLFELGDSYVRSKRTQRTRS